MKTGVLTSSRADYGILRPLLRELASDPFFDLQMLVFGTHLSPRFGSTVSAIEADGYTISHRIITTPDTDTPAAIALSMADTIKGFSQVWQKDAFDMLIALGDRYEMFAAVASSVPFNIPVAHIHGGETTMGAIDNGFRHSITHFSTLHFASCEQYRDRIVQMTGSEENVFNAGALSMDNMKSVVILTPEEFREKYGADISKPFILMTFHPETVGAEKNTLYVSELIKAIEALDRYRFIITMPNADTMGLHVRESFQRLAGAEPRVTCVESLGTQGYFTCLKHCAMMLGNSSSGFTEALFFDKPVVNTGNRQQGRIVTANIFNCDITAGAIVSAVMQAERYVTGSAANIYGDGHAASFIAGIIRDYLNKNRKADG